MLGPRSYFHFVLADFLLVFVECVCIDKLSSTNFFQDSASKAKFHKSADTDFLDHSDQ